MINTVDTPNLTYSVVILEIEQKMINIDGIDTIPNETEEKYQWIS